MTITTKRRRRSLGEPLPLPAKFKEIASGMRHKILLLVCVFLLHPIYALPNSQVAAVRLTAEQSIIPYHAGEKSVFSITYLGATAGKLELLVKDNGSFTHSISAEASTDFVFSLFYRLQNIYQSEVGATTGLPIKFSATIDESGQKGTIIQNFSERKSQVHVQDKRNRFKKGIINADFWKPAPPNLHDAISALFYLRRQPLSLGKTYDLPIFIGEESVLLQMKVTSEEILPTKIGDIPSWIVSPSLLKNGRQENVAESYIWIGKDGSKPILKISAKVKIGKIIAYLKSYQPKGEQKRP